MTNAPITLFVYNRLDHTKKTVEALQRNFLAKESALFIFSDGPKNDQAKGKVEVVRNYLRTISGFKEVKIIERDKNYGLAKSIIEGVTEIVNKFGRIIVLEDDLVTSPYFLSYLNEALDYYEKEEEVISIHGYTYPIKKDLSTPTETFFIRGADCWGWGTWKRGWDLFEADGKKLLASLKQKKLLRKFDLNNSYSYSGMLRGQIAGQNDSWAIRWHASAFLANKLTLYPGKTLVQNIGFDDSGSHSGDSKNFDTRLSLNKVMIQKIPKVESEEMIKEFEYFFKSLKQNIFVKIKDKIKVYLSKEQFNPKVLGIFINPFYITRKELRKNIKDLSGYIHGRVLDVGCGTKPYKELFKFSEYLGMDIERDSEHRKDKNIDIFYDGSTFPFPDNSFDSIISNEVLEHVFNPKEHLDEIYRVLKPHGHLLLSAPFLWDEHEQPYDYARYSSFGLSHLLESSGFKVIEKKKSVADVRAIFQIINVYIFKKTLWLRKKYINIIVTLILNAPFNILGEALNFILPKNSELYLDNIIIATK